MTQTNPVRLNAVFIRHPCLEYHNSEKKCGAINRLSSRPQINSTGATQPIVGVYFTALYRALASSRTRLIHHTQRRATVGRTPLNE